MMGTDITIFCLLLIASTIVWFGFRRKIYAATNAFSIVMSLGIFATFALTRLPGYSLNIGKIITFEIIIVWLFLAGSIIKSFAKRHSKIHTKDVLQRFKIGTWVAGSGVLTSLLTHTLPDANWLSYGLAAVTLVVYIPFVFIFAQDYVKLWQAPRRQHSTGVVLLATVATQSVIIMLHTIFGGQFPVTAAPGLAVFDTIFLLCGLALIFIAHRNLKINSLAKKWDNTNCIIHGAVSITGLAIVQAGCFSNSFMTGVWIITAGLFLAVETIEAVRAVQRTKLYGIRRGLLVYNVSQWSRNFTFGMFYAFTFSLNHVLTSTESGIPGGWQVITGVVTSWGQYVVLALLLVEVFLTLRANFTANTKPQLVIA